MGKEYTVQEALKMAIQAEKDSMDFYRRAASVTKNERAKKVFEMLANEEVGHLKAFFDHYRGTEYGNLTDFIESEPNKKNATYLALEKAIDEGTHEKKALEIALKEEKACVDQYTLLVKDVIDPLVRAIFERVIKETQNHHDVIEDEYRHIMAMVDRSDQDIYVRE
ncbi:ferritin family protein [Geobacter sp. DSM 9736]|uniref:ferritin family protein n=1 Tax=Geobacter sp. DSM 9736 TaxID=1277350 RepID=UPI000B512042|nr:ferritin family protein [Geobacter sp. DSM 9736]SNB47622.1 Rubrerythrin [Geobacter sp. DSM 9736]